MAALENGVGIEPALRVRRVGAVQDHRGGHVADEGVDDDEPEDGAQGALVAHEQVHARPQHHGLARHHARPAHDDEGAVDGAVADERQVLGQEADGVDGDAPRRHHKGPVVQALAPLKGRLDDDDELDKVVKGDGQEALDGAAGGPVGEAPRADAQVGRARHQGKRKKKEKEEEEDRVMMMILLFFFGKEVVSIGDVVSLSLSLSLLLRIYNQGSKETQFGRARP